MQLRGTSGFFGGLQARVIFQMPATAISWFVYETFKNYLSRRSEKNDFQLLSSVQASDSTDIQTKQI